MIVLSSIARLNLHLSFGTNRCSWVGTKTIFQLVDAGKHKMAAFC